jgi:hypothetical protein
MSKVAEFLMMVQKNAWCKGPRVGAQLHVVCTTHVLGTLVVPRALTLLDSEHAASS